MSLLSEKNLAGLNHEKLMRRAIELSVLAMEKGNSPFGALLANLDGEIVLEAETTSAQDGDATAHAEQNLMSKASRFFTREELGQLVMYTSTEPCAMCTGATFFTGVRALVFGLSEQSLYDIWRTEDNPKPTLLRLDCRSIFATAKDHPTIVIGPVLEHEAAAPHEMFSLQMSVQRRMKA